MLSTKRKEHSIDIAPQFVTSSGPVIKETQTPIAPVDDGSPVCRDYAAESDVLIVSFSGLKKNPDKIPGFSLRHTLTGLPVKKLFVRDLNRAWFLKGLHGITRTVEETVAFLRAEAAAVGARRIVLTGYSMGGFAALLHGALLGADEVQAISPQTFISFWHRLSCSDYRWRRQILPLHFGPTRRYHDLRPWLLRCPEKTPLHVQFARDSRLDTVHAQYVRDVPQVIVHEHAERGHRLISALGQNGELRTILERAIAGESLHAASGQG